MPAAALRGPRMLRPDEVARRLGVTTTTLSRWRKAGHGPPWIDLPSGTKRYPEPNLEQWVAGRLRCRS